MKTERTRYTGWQAIKAALAKKLMRMAHRLTSPGFKPQELVMVAFTETPENLRYEIFGDPVSVDRFKVHFQHPDVIGESHFTLERHYVKTTEPLDGNNS